MSELVFLKLGGSLITDKRHFETARPAVIERLAHEICRAQSIRPDMQLVLGHGSGSFGHFWAERYKVHEGHPQDWRGYAETGAAAQRLNRLVTDALLRANVPVVSIQPSASARCHEGEIVEMAVDPLEGLLERGLVPLVYGDVALDTAQGCTILSTEQLFIHLARVLRPQRIIMAGEVGGVYSSDPHQDPDARLIPAITAQNYAQVEQMLSASHGVDVTGGMLQKVGLLFELVREQPELTVRIVTGEQPHVIERVLASADAPEGTVLKY